MARRGDPLDWVMDALASELAAGRVPQKAVFDDETWRKALRTLVASKEGKPVVSQEVLQAFSERLAFFRQGEPTAWYLEPVTTVPAEVHARETDAVLYVGGLNHYLVICPNDLKAPLKLY